ncbi:MAG: DUF4836 family protein [Alistipes sp.]|nr:DUF4836 family protein [Alistipes sp.]
MKKILLWVFAIGIAIGVAVITYFMISKNHQEETLAPIEDSVFVYANLEQLATKGAFDKFITADNRRLIATAFSSQIDDAEQSQHLSGIVTNLNATGIDLHGRAYGYLCDDLESFVIVANVLNVVDVDHTVNLFSHLLEKSGEEAITVEQDGNIRTFEYDNITVAYNDSRIAFVLGDDNSRHAMVESAITRPKSDLAELEGNDIAIIANFERLILIMNSQIEKSTTELQSKLNRGEISDTHYTKQIEEINRVKDLITTYTSHFEIGAKATISANFDLGRAAVTCKTKGINYGEYSTLFKATNTTHLSYLNSDAYAVISMGVNGNILAQLVRTLLNDEFLSTVGITPTNEMSMILSIACDALSTIDGGVTLALNSIDGNVKRTYDYYWDEYSITPNIKSVEAMLMADVSDTYIINNIAQFAGGFLRKVDPMHYTLRLMNYNLSMGQDEQLFHLGVNMSPNPKTPSALDCEWTKDIEGSYGYIVANIDAMMNGDLLSSANKIIVRNIIDEYRSIYTDSMEAISYIYASAKGLDSAEVVVVFDNRSINALEQINSIVLPVLVSEGIKAMI